MAKRLSDGVVRRVVEATDLAALVSNRGVRLRKSGSSLLGCCPLHGEKTPSFYVHPDKHYWKCFGCGEGGDAIKFLQRLTDCSFLDAVAELARAAGIDLEEGVSSAARLPPRPAAAPMPKPPPNRPPAPELEALWTACRPVSTDDEVSTWLRSRGIDPAAVEEEDFARALPTGATLPNWAGTSRSSWTASGHRLLFATYGATGHMESVRARCVRQGAKIKVLPPCAPEPAPRLEVREMVLADSVARLMLMGGKCEHGTGADLVKALGLVIVEGEPDLLSAWQAWGHGRERAPAMLGIYNGGWSAEIAARIPNGARVVFVRHDDTAGEGYLEEVRESLGGRCQVKSLDMAKGEVER